MVLSCLTNSRVWNSVGVNVAVFSRSLDDSFQGAVGTEGYPDVHQHLRNLRS